MWIHVPVYVPEGASLPHELQSNPHRNVYSQNYARSSAAKKCYRCNNPGHFARNCAVHKRKSASRIARDKARMAAYNARKSEKNVKNIASYEIQPDVCTSATCVNKCKQLEEEVAELKEECRDLETQLGEEIELNATTNTYYLNYESKYKDVQMKLEESLKQTQTLETNMQQQEVKIENFKTEIAALQVKNRKLQDRNSELESKIENLEDKRDGHVEAYGINELFENVKSSHKLSSEMESNSPVHGKTEHVSKSTAISQAVADDAQDWFHTKSSNSAIRGIHDPALKLPAVTTLAKKLNFQFDFLRGSVTVEPRFVDELNLRDIYSIANVTHEDVHKSRISFCLFLIKINDALVCLNDFANIKGYPLTYTQANKERPLFLNLHHIPVSLHDPTIYIYGITRGKFRCRPDGIIRERPFRR